MQDSVAQIVAEVAATADWMPPQIDRAARRQCLDQRGPDAFEKEYGCRLRSDVYQLWTCERHKRFEQKSQPWHDFRDTRLTASVVPAVLEYVTFSGESRRKKFLGYIGLGAPFVQNPACDWGVKYEDSGMYALEQVLTRESHKAVYLPFDIIDSKTPETHPWAFSPDGIGCDGTVAECKVPWRRVIEPGKYKENYGCQVQFGMHVIDGDVGSGLCERSYLFEYKPPANEFDNSNELINIVTLCRDPQWATLNCWLLHEFWAEVVRFRTSPPPALFPDHYSSEAATSKWYRERVMAAPDRFHKHQRTLFSTSAAAASLKRRREEAAKGDDIVW